MTAKQLELLKGIARWKQNSGRWPSFREMAREMGIAVFAVQKRVLILERDGMVRKRGDRYVLGLTDKGTEACRSSCSQDFENPWTGDGA